MIPFVDIDPLQAFSNTLPQQHGTNLATHLVHNGLFLRSRSRPRNPRSQEWSRTFRICALFVESGAFRTQFLTSGSKKNPAKPMTVAYAGTPVEITLKKFDDMDGKQKGDAKNAVSVIFDVVTKSGVAEGLDRKWLRLPLARDCVMRYEAKVEGMMGNLEAVRGLVEGLDVGE